MTKLAIEMPIVSRCTVSQCAYNQKQSCHAKAITVGDGRSPRCDTFFTSQLHTQEKTRTAGVGACKVTGCQYNSDFECTAKDISVAATGQEVKCMTYAPAQRATA